MRITTASLPLIMLWIIGRLASPAVRKKPLTPYRTPDGKTLPYAFGWFVQTYRNVRLVWHSGWDEEAGFSAMYLKVPDCS